MALFPSSNAIPSPTVTAVNVPPGISWQEFDAKLRQQGLVVAGSYGPLTDKVFRLGHMGTQADKELVTQALDVIRKVRYQLIFPSIRVFNRLLIPGIIS